MVHPMFIFEFERVFACKIFDAAMRIEVDLSFFRAPMPNDAQGRNTRDAPATGKRTSANKASTSFASWWLFHERN